MQSDVGYVFPGCDGFYGMRFFLYLTDEADDAALSVYQPDTNLILMGKRETAG